MSRARISVVSSAGASFQRDPSEKTEIARPKSIQQENAHASAPKEKVCILHVCYFFFELQIRSRSYVEGSHKKLRKYKRARLLDRKHQLLQKYSEYAYL